MRLFFWLRNVIIFLLLLTHPADAAQVWDVSGRAEVLEPGSRRWKSVSGGDALKEGASLRTHRQSFLEILLDRNAEEVLRLGESSQAKWRDKAASRIHLEKGSLWVLREGGDFEEASPFAITTREALIQLGSGGCQIQTSRRGTLVKAFGGGMQISRQSGEKFRLIPEAHKFFRGASGKGAWMRRMHFSDYVGWSSWLKEFYKRKDKWASEAIF